MWLADVRHRPSCQKQCRLPHRAFAVSSSSSSVKSTLRVETPVPQFPLIPCRPLSLPMHPLSPAWRVDTMQVVVSLVSCALARLRKVALPMLGRARGFVATPNQHALPRPLPPAPIEGFNRKASNPRICIAAIHMVACSILLRQCIAYIYSGHPLGVLFITLKSTVCWYKDGSAGESRQHVKTGSRRKRAWQRVCGQAMGKSKKSKKMPGAVR